MFIASGVRASDLEVSCIRTPVVEKFDGFRGTPESLPAGFSVSKDGQLPLSLTNDFHGTNDGGVVTGGCYAWAAGTNDFALGCQPTASSFNPGYFMLTMSNATSSVIRRMSVEYEILYFNDAERASIIDFEFSTDGLRYSRIEGQRVFTPAGREKEPSWMRVRRTVELMLPHGVPASGKLWIKWCLFDSAGSGSRDEVGLDNVKVTLFPPAGTAISVM